NPLNFSFTTIDRCVLFEKFRHTMRPEIEAIAMTGSRPGSFDSPLTRRLRMRRRGIPPHDNHSPHPDPAPLDTPPPAAPQGRRAESKDRPPHDRGGKGGRLSDIQKGNMLSE